MSFSLEQFYNGQRISTYIRRFVSVADYLQFHPVSYEHITLPLRVRIYFSGGYLKLLLVATALFSEYRCRSAQPRVYRSTSVYVRHHKQNQSSRFRTAHPAGAKLPGNSVGSFFSSKRVTSVNNSRAITLV